MAWENLQEEVHAEFEPLVWNQATAPHAARSREWLSGYVIRAPKPPQNKRAEGRAKVNQCVECGEAIERSAHAKFCTTRCKNRYHQKQWVKAHPEWRPKPKRRPIQPATHTCKQCGAELPEPETALQNRRLYCDKKCRTQFYYQKTKREKPEQLTEKRRRFYERHKERKAA